jgi:hypothetical protein
MGHSLSLEHSLQFASCTPEPQSPHFETETFPEDLAPQGNLDDMPQGHSVTYVEPVITHLTPQCAMFKDLHHTPQQLGSTFHAPMPVVSYQTAHKSRFEHPPTTLLLEG